MSRVAKSKGNREAPYELPSNWKWMQLGQVSDLINGDRSKNNYTSAAAHKNAENAIYLKDDRAIAARYSKEWRRLWDELDPIWTGY